MEKIILAIETSCDDTSIAIVKGNDVLSMKTHSQIDEHAKFGGVIPELASRYHTKNIFNQIELTLQDTKYDLKDIEAIAVTEGPGMVNTLQVGLTVAKTLSQRLHIPMYAINHIEAHAFSPFISKDIMVNKALVVVASGGHTNLYGMDKLFEYKLLGQTKDDAIGESYDKVAKIMGLPYPGGPLIDKIAQENNYESNVKYPQPKVEGYDFSYSGLKSKTIQLRDSREYERDDILTAFQNSSIDHLMDRILRAIDEFGYKDIIIGGGVSANSLLRKELDKITDVNIYYPKLIYTGDNAAMIGYLASKKIEKRKIKHSQLDIDATPRKEM